LSKGRNSSVISVRLPDEMVRRLKADANFRGETLSKRLQFILSEYAVYPAAETIARGIHKMSESNKDVNRVSLRKVARNESLQQLDKKNIIRKI